MVTILGHLHIHRASSHYSLSMTLSVGQSFVQSFLPSTFYSSMFSTLTPSFICLTLSSLVTTLHTIFTHSYPILSPPLSVLILADRYHSKRMWASTLWGVETGCLWTAAGLPDSRWLLVRSSSLSLRAASTCSAICLLASSAPSSCACRSAWSSSSSDIDIKCSTSLAVLSGWWFASTNGTDMSAGSSESESDSAATSGRGCLVLAECSRA